MATAQVFVRFPALPLELRNQIWKTALSVPSVWAAVDYPCTAPNCGVHHTHPQMAFVGQAPYLVGRSCKEAWRLMEQIYVKPIRGPLTGSATKSHSTWVNLDTTVVHLGNDPHTEAVLKSFDTDDLSKFKHIAWPWSQFADVARTCQRLAAHCPALRNIIIQGRNPKRSSGCELSKVPKFEIADHFATIPTV